MSVPTSVQGESSDVRGMGGKGEGKGPGWMVRVRGSELGRLEACISILVCFFFFFPFTGSVWSWASCWTYLNSFLKIGFCVMFKYLPWLCMRRRVDILYNKISNYCWGVVFEMFLFSLLYFLHYLCYLKCLQCAHIIFTIRKESYKLRCLWWRRGRNGGGSLCRLMYWARLLGRTFQEWVGFAGSRVGRKVYQVEGHSE